MEISRAHTRACLRVFPGFFSHTPRLTVHVISPKPGITGLGDSRPCCPPPLPRHVSHDHASKCTKHYKRRGEDLSKYSPGLFTLHSPSGSLAALHLHPRCVASLKPLPDFPATPPTVAPGPQLSQMSSFNLEASGRIERNQAGEESCLLLCLPARISWRRLLQSQRGPRARAGASRLETPGPCPGRHGQAETA